jgi:hypothetical protein
MGDFRRCYRKSDHLFPVVVGGREKKMLDSGLGINERGQSIIRDQMFIDQTMDNRDSEVCD